MKNLILLITILSTSINTIGQDVYQNHQKYWFLRSKLRNDLMKVGLNQGESIPFAQRGLDTKTNNQANASGVTSGGDLISELGIYIGVLATEYKLLKNNNQNTDSVKHELYCALNAVNRLDYTAEPMYGNYSPSTNGFLVRDDIPKDFIFKNYKHFNYYNTWDGLLSSTTNNHLYNRPLDLIPIPNTSATDRGFHSSIQRGQVLTNSVFYSNFQYHNDHPSDPLSTYGNYAMSQDHIISLMYGLRLVSEYVDGGAMDNNQHFNYGDEAYYSILDEAGVISDRIVKYLKNNNWRIKKPNGYDVSDNDGGNVKAYAYALAQIAGKINLPGTSINHWPSGSSLVPIIDPAYHNTHSKNWGFTEFETAAKSLGTSFDITTQLGELTAACQCLFSKLGGNIVTTITFILQKLWKWLGAFLGWILHFILNILNTLIPISWNNTTFVQSLPNAIQLAPNANQLRFRLKYQQDYVLLTNMLLRGALAAGVPTQVINFYNSALTRTSNILNSAPCEGPMNFSSATLSSSSYAVTSNYNVREWSGYSLIEHTNILGSDNVDYAGSGTPTWGLQSGEFNGLDYMLYHNLYYLYETSKNGTSGINSIDLSNRFVNYTLPTSDGTGSQTNPTTIGAFEHIIADGHVNSNADVQFLTGKDFAVTYGSNYTIDLGAQVSVDVHRYNCSNNNYLGGSVMRTSNNKPDTNDVYGPIASSVKLHEVTYPLEFKKTTEATNNSKKNTVQNLYNNKNVVSLNNYIEVFPNPSNGTFNIKINSKYDDETYIISIFDITGKQVAQYVNLTSLNKTIGIKNPNLTTGTYLIKVIENKNGNQYTEKLIIQ